MNPNDRIHGFLVERAVPLEELKATLYQLRHEKTGLALVWLKRSEENKTFGIAFETLPWDDTGVFHILEHSVLCGSRRYPVKEPFVELMKHSMNTFLNAMTFPDKTVYPISSRNDKDFLNLTRVYLDAVFRPSIYEKPEIFGQEGWHYEFDSEGTPSYKGVVFNEMKGAFADAEELAGMALNRALFPDSPYRYVSGGAPASIPDLTYEAFLESHRRFYSPSNAYVFLDGDVDVDAVLALLEEDYLSGSTPTQRCAPPVLQAPVDGGVQEVPYELPDGEEAAGRTRLFWGSVLGTFADRERIAAMQVLSTVLCGSNQSPLSQAILSRGLAEDVVMSMIDDIAQPWVQLEVRNLDASNRARVEALITETLTRLAGEGLDRAQLEAAMANLEFKQRERDFGSYPQGLIFGLQVLESWLYGGAPEANLEVGDLFQRLRARMEEGYFEALLREVFLENPHRAQVVLTPSETAGEERRALEQARLDREAARWSQEDREALAARQQALEDWQHSEDSPEALATLPHLTLEDLSPQPEALPLREETSAGLPLLIHDVPTGGITYVTLYFDVAGRSGEELSCLSLLCRLLGKTATRRHTVEELTNRIRLLCGGMRFFVSSYGGENRPEDCTVKLCATFSALNHNVEEAAALAAEILTETVFEEESAVLDVLRQAKLQLFQQIVMSGASVALNRVAAQTAAAAVVEEHTSGYACYQWLREQESGWRWEPLQARLTAFLRESISAAALTVSVTGEDADLPAHLGAQLVRLLPERGAAYDHQPAPAPWGLRKEGIAIPADISFAALGGALTAHGGGRSGGMQLAGRILTLAYLWNVIRVQGGAYGTGLLVRNSGVTGCYSYRDPSAARSLEKYREAAAFLRSFCAGRPDLTGFIIGAVSEDSPLLTPRLKGLMADCYYWQGLTWERRCALRRELLSATPEGLAALADTLEETLAGGGICVIGSRQQLEACEGLEEILSL